MKTIGYVLADFPVLSETFVGDEMRAMMKAGHTVAPIVMHLRDGAAQAADIDLVAQALRPHSATLGGSLAVLAGARAGLGKAVHFAFAQRELPVASLLWNGLKIAAVARSRGCEHLHAHFAGGAAAHAIVAARLAGITSSFVCHGHDVYAEPEDLGVKLQAADAVVAVCKELACDLLKIEGAAKVNVVHCGIDPADFLPADDAPHTGRLLFVGRLVPQKGIDDLLTAMAHVGDAQIDIVGGGPMEAIYQDRATALGLQGRVRFLGAKPREWIAAHAPGYLGLVAPFKAAPDGARDTGPLVVKEAMAMGLPVVATRFMGLKEIVPAGTGYLAEPNVPASLAAALTRLLALSPKARAEMGARARRHVIAHFTLATQAESLSSLFEAA